MADFRQPSFYIAVTRNDELIQHVTLVGSTAAITVVRIDRVDNRPMFTTLPMRLLLIFILVLGLSSCDLDHRKKIRREVPHSGFRSDAPDAMERGNGKFGDASFDPSGRWLLTLAAFEGLRLWRASDGQFIKGLQGSPVAGWHFTADGGAVMMEFDKQPGYHLVSLPTGDVIASIAQDRDDSNQRLVGLTPDGSLALVISGDALEFWSLESGELVTAITGPWQPRPKGPGCGVYSSSYFTTQCLAFSPDNAWLAMAYTDFGDTRNPTNYYLVDLRRREFIKLDLPDLAKLGTAGLLFSPDSRTLAIGVSKGLLFFDMASRLPSPVVAGQHPRNQFLVPTAFSTPTTLVALADQLEVNIVDTAEGQIFRRHRPGDDWEGVFRVSRNGARVVLYHFRGDVLEVLNGRTGDRVGWVCPYFCNALHNPVAVEFAVTPNGSAVAASHSFGAAIWSSDTDALLAPLFDPHLKLLQK